jgi:hypothetical protein
MVPFIDLGAGKCATGRRPCESKELGGRGNDPKREETMLTRRSTLSTTTAVALTTGLIMGTPLATRGQQTSSSPELDDHYADVNGIRLHYKSAGKGELILFLHGFPEFWYE